VTPIATEPLNARLVDALYTEAMLLADEARSYFDQGARSDRLALDPLTRVGFSCEALKVTTRLMHIIAWLLTRRAVETGEIPHAETGGGGRRLGRADTTHEDATMRYPEPARALIAASCDLYARISRLEEGRGADGGSGPARALYNRLERSL
jgi:regulator of CtrA degradation